MLKCNEAREWCKACTNLEENYGVKYNLELANFVRLEEQVHEYLGVFVFNHPELMAGIERLAQRATALITFPSTEIAHHLVPELQVCSELEALLNGDEIPLYKRVPSGSFAIPRRTRNRKGHKTE